MVDDLDNATHVSEAMSERILRHMEWRKAQRPKDSNANTDIVGQILVAGLAEATTDGRAENLFALLNDWEEHGPAGAFGKLMTGEFNLVQLLVERGC